MTKKQDALRAIRIVNPYETCKRFGGQVWIQYEPWGDGRGARVAGVLVHSPHGDQIVDAAAHWEHRGAKFFHLEADAPNLDARIANSRSYSHLVRRETILRAQKWASEKYGIASWAKDPWGAWQDARVVERMNAMLAHGPAKKQDKEVLHHIE